MWAKVAQGSLADGRRCSSTVRPLSRAPANFAYWASAEMLSVAVNVTVPPYPTVVEDAPSAAVVGSDRQVLIGVVVSSGW